MSKTPRQLRQKARDMLQRARTAPPMRAAQYRDTARLFLRQARQQELFEHSRDVGRANVTLSTFRDHLRALRA